MQQRGVGGSHRVCKPVYCNGEVIENDHPSVILTGETIDGFSFIIIIIIIIMWFRIVITRVVAIGIIAIRTIITRNVVLLVITDFFNKCTGGMTSGGRAFPSRAAVTVVFDLIWWASTTIPIDEQQGNYLWGIAGICHTPIVLLYKHDIRSELQYNALCLLFWFLRILEIYIIISKAPPHQKHVHIWSTVESQYSHTYLFWFLCIVEAYLIISTPKTYPYLVNSWISIFLHLSLASLPCCAL